MMKSTKEQEPVRTLIVSSGEKGTAFLRASLPPGNFCPPLVVGSVTEARQLPGDSDAYGLILINAPLPDESGNDYAVRMAEETCAGVILVTRAEIYEQVCAAVEPSGVLTLPKPMPHGAMTSAIRLALATHNRLRQVATKTATLQKKMEEIKLINRAKLLLVSKFGMTEADAHRLIEKQAMDLRETRADVAENLIRTYES